LPDQLLVAFSIYSFTEEDKLHANVKYSAVHIKLAQGTDNSDKLQHAKGYVQ